MKFWRPERQLLVLLSVHWQLQLVNRIPLVFAVEYGLRLLSSLQGCKRLVSQPLKLRESRMAIYAAMLAGRARYCKGWDTRPADGDVTTFQYSCILPGSIKWRVGFYLYITRFTGS